MPALDQTDSEGNVPAEPAPRYVLQYVKGGGQRLLPLGDAPITIGRHDSCGLVFKDSSVSNSHARIELREGSYWIFDLGSTNGIAVNGKPVKESPLQPGQRIRLGNVTVGFKQIIPRLERKEE